MNTNNKQTSLKNAPFFEIAFDKIHRPLEGMNN